MSVFPKIQQSVTLYLSYKQVYKGGDMDREITLKPYYATSQSTILSSQFPPTKQLPTFTNNYNDPPDFIKPSLSTYTYNQSSLANPSNYNPQLGGMREEPYSNQHSNHYYYDNYGDGQSMLSRSAIIDNSFSGNSSKLHDLLSPTDRKFNLSKYANMSTTKLQEYKLQEQPEDYIGAKEDPPGQKTSQNISFQFSPKKTKKIQEQGFMKQMSGGSEQKPEIQKNNLSHYKRVELNPNRDKRSISNQVSGNIQFNFNTHSANSNTESPNNSVQQNKLLKREFSSGGKAGQKLESPVSSHETSYFGSHKKNQPSYTTKSQEFKKEDFVIIKRLGKGKYGDVSLALNKQIGVVCALKSILKDTILKDQGGINQFIREVTIQMFLSHQHIVECWGLFCDTDSVYLIMEPALDGQLFKYMRQQKHLEESEAASLIRQLCLGVQYLQSEKIIHRDLKPENILLHEGKLKIADFGWAVYNQDSFRETFCGTPLYLSPDVLKGDQYNDKVDNWAIGIITYEMMVGRIPFKITQESEMEKIITEEIQFPKHVSISDVAKDFILCLLDRNPDTRMDIEAILMHKFLAD